MKNLANKIQQYTKKEGNKILFKGDLTLSELALKMWEALDYQKIDPAILSRVIRGERLFTPEQLEIFCKILNLNKYELHDLRAALYKDYYEKYGIEIEPTISPYLLDIVKHQLNYTSQLRSLGQTNITIEWTSTLSSHVENIISSNSIKSSHPITKLYTQILLKEIRIYRQVLPSSAIVSRVKPLVGRLIEIAHDNHDKDLMGMSYYSLGCAYHIAGKHEQAAVIFQAALPLINKTDVKLMLLRHLSLSLAYMQRRNEFLSIETQILQALHSKISYNTPIICELSEGLARAQGILKMTRAENTWEDAKKINHQMNKNGGKIFVQDIQLMRTKLEIMMHLEPSEMRYVNNQAKDIRQLALEHGYIRHAKKLAKFIAE